MFIPVGTSHQVVLQVDKDEQGNVTEKELFDVMVSRFDTCIYTTLLNSISVCTTYGQKVGSYSIKLLQQAID